MMEKVRGVKMKVQIETDRRTVEEEFGNLFDLKLFMDGFFSGLGDRRSGESDPTYAGPERRMRLG
jgi:hypothetical protein